MTIVLDTGALIAIERNDRATWRLLKSARAEGTPLLTHGGVVGQAWRKGGARQALLAKALAGIEVRPLDEALGRAAGRLLADTRGSDVVDAALVILANDDDVIVTSDPDDLAPLARAHGLHVELLVV